MKLGLLSACMPERSLERGRRLGRRRTASTRSSSPPGRGSATARSSPATSPRDGFDEAEVERVRRRRSTTTGSSSRRSPTTTTTCIREPRAARGRSTATCARASTSPRRSAAFRSAPSSAATTRTQRRREPARGRARASRRSSTTPASAACKLMIENCVMEGWHPDGYPGNLAYSPELWEWMFDLGLWLNFDPSHLLWIGIDPVAALEPVRRPGDPRPRQGRRDLPRRAQPLRLLRPHLDARAGSLGHGLVAVPRSRPRPGRLPRLRRDAARGRLRRRALGRARGSGVGRHARRRSRAGSSSPSATCGRWWPADGRPPRRTPVLEVRDLVKEYPGVKALRGVDFEVRAGEVHCLLGPNGAGKSTLIKCVSGAVEPTAGEILVQRRAAAAGRPGRHPEPRRRHDLPGARPGRGPDGRPEHLPRARASPRPVPRPGADAQRLGGAAGAPRTRGDRPAGAGQRAAPGGPAGGLDRPRALARRPPAGHGRALGDPRRGRDRDPVRGRAPAHRRGRRRRLHLPPPRRDPPHRRPGDRAQRRAHGRHRDPRLDLRPTSWSS